MVDTIFICKLFFDSFLTTLTEVVTIWGFVYALPNFLQKMRAENAATIAAETLKILPNLIKKIRNLLQSVDRKRANYIDELLCTLMQFQANLDLLPLKSQIKDELQIQMINPLINSSSKNDKMISFFENTLGDEWRQQMEQNNPLIKIQYLEKLKIELNKIYKNPISAKLLSILWLIGIALIINFVKNIWFL